MDGTCSTGGEIYIYIYIFESLKGRDFLGDCSSNRTTLKLGLIETLCECGDWTKLAKSTVQCWAGLNVLGAST
jgi:hypothetical protein